MSRARRGESIKGWLSARPDSAEKRFVQVGNTLLLSKTFQELSTGARHTYLCMAMESGGKREFTFPRAAAIKYGISARSLLRYVEELTKAKFITVRSGKTVRQPSEYAFSFEWKSREVDK